MLLAVQADDRSETVRRPLLSGWQPLFAAVTVFVCVAITAALSFAYAGFDDEGWLDTRIMTVIGDAFDGRRALLRAMVHLADARVVVAVLVVVIGYAVYRRRPRLIVVAVLGPILAMAATEAVLKPLVGRSYYGMDLAFPSGHTTGITSALTVAMVLALGVARLKWWHRVLIAIPMLAVLLDVTVALIGLQYHFPTDTLGGFCVAVGTVLGVSLVVDAVANRLPGRSGNRNA